jgi:hypothetical protein
MLDTNPYDRHTQIFSMSERSWPLADALGALGALRWRRDHPREGRSQTSPIPHARSKYGIISRDINTIIAEMECIVKEEKEKAHRRYQEVTM